jgi:mono/diheme cytochrome c family protein
VDGGPLHYFEIQAWRTFKEGTMQRRTQLTLLVAALLVVACVSQNRPPPGGAETFSRHCASCHGARGDGDGPVADIIRGTIPDLTTLARRNGGEFPAARVASYIDGRSVPPAHGSRTMPVWGAVFDATARLVVDAETAGPRVAELVEYLRSLQRPEPSP